MPSAGEFKVHNVKFYDLEPKAIHCLAYNHTGKHKLLALSRSDGSVEVWDLEFTPHLVQILDAGPGESIESLAWSKDRLFSTGLQGDVVEFDLAKSTIKQREPVIGGPSWCLSANNSATTLAIGTENGQVCLMTIKDEEELMSTKTLDRQEGRILCVSWHRSDEYLVTGSVDYLRVWHVEVGQCITKILAGRAHKNQETIVWCASILSDFTVVSGDSRGKVSFWNGHTGTSETQFQSHKADVLCLCVDPDENSIYASGVDPSIVSFQRVKKKDGDKWVKASSRNVHTHDVRAITITPRFLISGGVDSYLCMSYYPPKLLWKYPPVPQLPCAVLASNARCILLRYTNSIDLWRLGVAKESEPDKKTLALSLAPSKLLRLSSKRQERIVCAALSSDANVIVYSTHTHLRAFSFTFLEQQPHLNKFACSSDVEPSLCMTFISSPSEVLLASSTLENIQILNISTEGGVVVQREIERSNPDKTVHLFSSSEDGCFLAAADVSGDITVYDLKTFQVHCQLPKYRCKATAMSIHPSTNELVAVYSDHRIAEYHVHNKAYTQWGKQLLKEMPSQWQTRMNCVSSISFDVTNKDVVFLQDDSTITVIDKSVKIEPGAKIARLCDTSDSNSTQGALQPNAFTFCKKYKHLLHLSRLSSDELVIVQVDPISLSERLPPTLKQKRFGV